MVLAQHCSSRDTKHRDPPPYPGPGTGCALYQPGEELFVLVSRHVCIIFVCIVGFESGHACSVTFLSGCVNVCIVKYKDLFVLSG